MISIGLAFIGGTLAFAHCLGMCGGFALHLAEGRTKLGVLALELLWHAGRITTYAFLGALAGFAGASLGSALPQIQNVLAYVAGGAMILAGLALAGLLPTRGRRDAGEGGLLESVFRQFIGRPTPGAALALGLATGFLPCPIVVAFLALAAASGSVLAGMATMAAMGAGTIGPLLALGMTGAVLRIRLRRWAMMVAAIILVLLGVATVLRGTEAYHRLLGCPPSPAEAAAPPCPHHAK